MNDTVSVISQQIALYTNQLEEYERLSAEYVMTVVGFAGVIFGIIITLLGYRQNKRSEIIKALEQKNVDWKSIRILKTEKRYGIVARERMAQALSFKKDFGRKTNDVNKRYYNYNPSFDWELANINRAISILFMVFPILVTLFLYIFSMHCRKSAIYRGYLAYLEDEINKRIDVPLLLNNRVVARFFGSFPPESFHYDQFLTNSLGSIVMILFVFGFFVIGFSFSFYFSNLKMEIHKKTKFSYFYRFFGLALIIVSVVFSIVCLYDLTGNGVVISEVQALCQQNRILY